MVSRAGDSFNTGLLGSLAAAGFLNKAVIRSISESDTIMAMEFGDHVTEITVGGAGSNPRWKHKL